MHDSTNLFISMQFFISKFRFMIIKYRDIIIWCRVMILWWIFLQIFELCWDTIFNNEHLNMHEVATQKQYVETTLWRHFFRFNYCISIPTLELFHDILYVNKQWLKSQHLKIEAHINVIHRIFIFSKFDWWNMIENFFWSLYKTIS